LVQNSNVRACTVGCSGLFEYFNGNKLDIAIPNQARLTHFTKNKYIISAKVLREKKSVTLLHSLPYFISSRPHLHRQHHPKTPEIVNRFGNHKRALRTAKSELVGVTPAAAPFLAESIFNG